VKFLYYFIVYPLSLLPLRLLYLVTDFFFLIFLIFPYRKRVVRTNIERSFPNKTLKERRRIERNFYHHFTDLIAESVKNLSISKKQLLKRITVKNPEIMDQLFHKNQGVLLSSGHYNNWEWLITSQNLLFKHQAMGIGMPLTSKFWDKKLNERRARTGMNIVSAKNLKENLLKKHEKPLAILILGDQSPGDSLKSYWMNFLNQTTAVQFGTEQLANEYNFAVVHFILHKIKRGYYSMELQLISDDTKSLNWGEITEKQTQLLEKAIIDKPEFWIWSHKRWKRTLPDDINALKTEQKAKFEARYRK
jgi:KDO2-lipid IV(A) lauroyltransferase